MKPPIEYRPRGRVVGNMEYLTLEQVKEMFPEPKRQPTFDRKAYQREYMRKRRAAKRNGTNSQG